MGLENEVLLLGHRDDVPSLLAATDLYLSASESEGLPFNLMEAMAFGLPIVASNVRGQRDLLLQNPEMLYTAGDMESFCKRITAVYQSGKKGSGSCSYPELEQYRLCSVFEDNMKILTMGLE
jgi:glycosyltransferase EpsD